jgi:hypothetical protein
MTTRRKTTEEFVRDAVLVHGNKYDYSKVKYIGNKSKVIIICKEHGEFLQKPNTHLTGAGCSKCAGCYNYTTEEWVKKAKEIHNNTYDYSKVDYKTNKSKVIIICKEHGEFLQKPNTHLTGAGCSKCAGCYNYTTEEWVKKAKEIHGDKYNYEKVDYKTSKSKVIIICREHGEFLQIPADHVNGFNCYKCSGNYIPTTEEWILKAKEIHSDTYDYSKVDYKKCDIKIYIICKIHGEFLQTPNAHLQGYGCSKCAGCYSPTTLEWIENAKKIHSDTYDYSKVDYKKSNEKVIIICKTHGEFLQNPSSHLQGRDCSKCAYIVSGNNHRKSQEEFIKQASHIHNNKYDYSKVNYISSQENIIIICKIHGEFLQNAHCHSSGQGCSKCAGRYSPTTEEWIERANKKHNYKFVYDKVFYKKSNEKVIIICKEHGDFLQTPSDHIQGYGCSKCAGTYSYTTEEWIKIANKKHNSVYDYSNVKYIGNKTDVIIICKTHGEFLQTPNRHLRSSGCIKCQLCPSCQLWRTNGKLCGYCLPKNKNKLYQKTKEYAVVKYLKEHLPDYDFIHNQSVGSECTKGDKEKSNGHLYPDIRYDCGHYHLIVEVDEHRHRGADYKCDKQRMYDIIAKLGLPCIFIRYNPDSQESNKEILLQKIKDYLDIVESDDPELWNEYGFKAEYLFY